jgi:hypothetical protein
MMQKSVSSILKTASGFSDEAEKIKYLQANASPTVKLILRYCFDPSIKWLLPKGPIAYKPLRGPGNGGALYHEVRRLYLFIDGGHETLDQKNREKLFVGMLENLDEHDAELLISIKDKKLPHTRASKPR